MRIEVPAGWSPKALKDLGSTYPGLAGKTKADFGEGIPFVTYKQVFAGGEVALDECALVSVSPEERQHRVQSGDVLFTTSSETPEEVAYSAVVLRDMPELYLNSFCFGYRPTSANALWPRFSAYLFHGPNFRRAAVRLGQGSTRFNISKNRLMDVVLPLPPLPEQKKIAAILSSVDEAIAATQAVIEQTRRVKEGLLQDLLTKGIGHTRFKQTEIGEIPEGWEVMRMDELSSRDGMVGGPFGSDLVSDDYVEPPGIPVIRGGNVSPGIFNDSGFVYVSAQKAEALRRNWARPGDLVMTQRGASLGQATLLPMNAKYPVYVVSQTMMRMSPAPERLSPGFLSHFVSSPIAQRWLQRQQTATGQPHLNLTIFRRMPMVVPPLREQESIQERIDSLDASMLSGRKNVDSAKRSKSGLLQDLLTGKVRVSA
jgi:type I restriction enzyme, S subunit